ncbi:MAG: HIT domain-containing protein [Acidobacteria bacterium]|nr:HIT domain-containing protein [Acidobacteriota bacterium]
MDVLWSPWRYDYIKSDESNAQKHLNNCVFCGILTNSASDEDNFILHRAEFNFVILNIYPYVSGHLMILPYEHIANLHEASKEITDELMDLTKKFQAVMREVYQPQGINIGMNQGKAAGAGVADHFHMHMLPRWIGDANFMTAIGETRTIPESLRETYHKYKSAQ